MVHQIYLPHCIHLEKLFSENCYQNMVGC